MNGVDALVNGKRARLIYNCRNIQATVHIRKTDGIIKIGDSIKIDTNQYKVIGEAVSHVPEVLAYKVKLDFFR